MKRRHHFLQLNIEDLGRYCTSFFLPYAQTSRRPAIQSIKRPLPAACRRACRHFPLVRKLASPPRPADVPVCPMPGSFFCSAARQFRGVTHRQPGSMAFERIDRSRGAFGGELPLHEGLCQRQSARLRSPRVSRPACGDRISAESACM